MSYQTTIEVIVTEERRIINNYLIEFRLACETKPPGWGMFSGSETIGELARAVEELVASHNVSDPHYHIIPSEGNLPIRKKTKDHILYTTKPSQHNLKKLKRILGKGVLSQAHIVYA
jgi:hypothetical protein